MVSEWQRTSPLRLPGALLYPAAILSLVVLVRGRSRVSVSAWGLLIVLTLMALWAERGVAWWAMGMVYLLGGVLVAKPSSADVEELAEVPPPTAEPGFSNEYLQQARARRASRLNGAVAALLIALLIAALPWRAPAGSAHRPGGPALVRAVRPCRRRA